MDTHLGVFVQPQLDPELRALLALHLARVFQASAAVGRRAALAELSVLKLVPDSFGE